MSQLDFSALEQKCQHLPVRTLTSLSTQDRLRHRIVWTGAVAPTSHSLSDSDSNVQQLPQPPATGAILFHSLRAETRAQVYATDLMFDPSSLTTRRRVADRQFSGEVTSDEEEEFKNQSYQHHHHQPNEDLDAPTSSDSDDSGEPEVAAADHRVFIPEWISCIEDLAGEIEDEEMMKIVHDAVDDIVSDVHRVIVDFLDRKIVWFAEKALGTLSERFRSVKMEKEVDEALEKMLLADTSRVVEILVLAEKVWFLLRGSPVPISLLNVSQAALRFHAVLFTNETVGKLRLLLSEALAIEAEYLDIRLASSPLPVYAAGRKDIVDDSEPLHQFLSRNNFVKPPTVLMLRFATTNEKEVFFRTDHFMHDLEARKLKAKVVDILEEIFYTHAPNPLLQEANRTLFCLASKFSKDSPLTKLVNHELFDQNLIGEIFCMSRQRSVLDLDRLTQHILSCGISPLSTSASRDRVLNVMRFYGRHIADQNPEAYEMDLEGFIRFYTDAFLERPMLSWYDYLAYGYSHEFERDSRIVPLCMSIQSVSKSERSRYETFSVQDYLQGSEMDEKLECSKKDERSTTTTTNPAMFWATNRVEFTCRGVLERPDVLSMMESACRHPQLRDVSQTVGEVLVWRSKNKAIQGMNYSSGKVAPIAALYL
eukprot:TRINITY_DN2490_c0_g1_i1.p1 TRINITY_DN2490_c0_g1~~TRINITY_DN2490_c0_g1_i1.p1  ORF type:complete len:651 (+),score=133.14 TRINITY_DN2490_c0_g1_i1:166-2118(+)